MKSFASLYDKVEASPAYQGERLAVAFLSELNAVMLDKGITNAELARRIGVSGAYITKLFRGPSNLSVGTLAKLAEAVECKIHLHLASHAAKVRWLDVFHEPRPVEREVDPNTSQFVRVLGQLKPITQEKSNDEKFALAA